MSGRAAEVPSKYLRSYTAPARSIGNRYSRANSSRRSRRIRRLGPLASALASRPSTYSFWTTAARTGPARQRFGLQAFHFLLLADVGGEANDFTTVVLSQPGDDHRSVQSPRVGEDDGLNLRICHGVLLYLRADRPRPPDDCWKHTAL